MQEPDLDQRVLEEMFEVARAYKSRRLSFAQQSAESFIKEFIEKQPEMLRRYYYTEWGHMKREASNR